MGVPTFSTNNGWGDAPTDREITRFFRDSEGLTSAGLGLFTSFGVQGLQDGQAIAKMAMTLKSPEIFLSAETMLSIDPNNPVAKNIAVSAKQDVQKVVTLIGRLPEIIKNAPDALMGAADGLQQEYRRGTAAFKEGNYAEAFYHYGKIIYPILMATPVAGVAGAKGIQGLTALTKRSAQLLKSAGRAAGEVIREADRIRFVGSSEVRRAPGLVSQAELIGGDSSARGGVKAMSGPLRTMDRSSAGAIATKASEPLDMHASKFASLSDDANIHSITRNLRQSRTQEGVAVAKLIKRRPDLVEISMEYLEKPSGGHYDSRTGKIKIFEKYAGNSRQAAGLMAHEAEHLLQKSGSQYGYDGVYAIRQEVPAYLVQAKVDKGFSLRSENDIVNFLVRSELYPQITRDAAEKYWKTGDRYKTVLKRN